MAIRQLDSALRNALLKEDGFVYAHLVKFERPRAQEGEKARRKAEDYIYLTDGSFDIAFDDGSSDIDGTDNGSQTYIANKVQKVGSVAETIEARATNYSLQIDATALDTSLEDSFTITTTSITSSEDLVAEGFREGDVVELVASSGSNKGKLARITSFETDNTVAKVEALEGALSAETATYTLTFKSPEVEGIISDRSGSGYARYINRDVFVYKAFINPETGEIIGEPYTLFKGIIGGGKLSEDPMKGSTMNWNITSHWGDFNRVQGRLTSDAHHRALDQNNLPDVDAVIKPEYTKDLGFLHSEQAINLVAIYQVKETRTKMKMKRKWYGSKKYKLVEYQVEVDREADLRFNLEAKYLPVVYGINKIDSIPVFVDTLNNDAKQVFCAYAICEGQVGGLYDIYFDDTSSICIDENDSNTRSSQTAENTIDVLCTGRADRGDVITPQTIASSNRSRAPMSGFGRGGGIYGWYPGGDYEAFATEYFYNDPLADASIGSGATSQGAGITHEKGTKFTVPIDSVMQFHTGKPNQKADSILLKNANNFKIATDYYDGDDPYWGAQHQLLDTAYLVAKYTIGEGETTIPSLDFVVRGKGINCYNYDFSYADDPAYTDTASNFNIGQTVTIKSTAGDVLQDSNAVIADIYTITNVEGDTETRFRFKEKPDLSSSIKAFYITDGTNDYHLVTWDYVGHSGTVPGELQEEITSQTSTTVTGGNGIDITVSSGNPSAPFNIAVDMGEFFNVGPELTAGIRSAGYDPRYLDAYAAEENYTDNSGVIENVGQTTTGASEIVSEYVTVLDAVRLGSNASSDDDAYNQNQIVVTRTLDDGSVRKQTRIITDYDGTNKVAKVGAPFELPPGDGDTYEVFSTVPDVRVSTNPAMQLLDYLTDVRYGRGLDKDVDIDLESFFEAARACDTRSNVTIIMKDEPTDDTIYEYKVSGTTYWQGKVKNVTEKTINSTTYYEVEFEEVLGKLLHRWENWKYFYTNELYYYDGVLYKAPSDGVISTKPNGVLNKYTGDLDIAKTDGTGAKTISYDLEDSRAVKGITADGDPVIRSVRVSDDGKIQAVNSGYEIYDSDDVKYWRYLGWEAQNQRHVTRHQTNAIIDTSSPVFENINGMLKHFNGVLRYSSGKYALSVMQASQDSVSVTVDGTTYKPEEIDEGDIIGSISVEDAGQKGTYNQVDVSINDPQNRFEGRSVMMFNSTYLKQDRMIPRKGTFQAPYVTNYFNARINAKQYLDQSRSGLKINFTMGPKGLLLMAGEVIKISYPRFGWSNKMYRVTNLTFKEDCLVQVTAEEHDDNTYIIDKPERGEIRPSETALAPKKVPPNPDSLTATTDKRGGVVLNWSNASNFDEATHSTQIWRSDDNDRANATLVATVEGTTHTDPIVEGGSNDRFYWIRHSIISQITGTSGTTNKKTFSAYHPTDADAGVSATSLDNRGEKGELGDKGNEGAKGSEGPKGDAGPKGDQGAKGESGGDGEKGQKGEAGDKGVKGVQGDGGDKGAKGEAGDKGVKGVQGDGGVKGVKGGVGDAGAKGVQGDGGDKGTKGGVGEDGVKGVQGDGGAKGATGETGAKGAAGEAGAKGAQGDQGAQGAKGSTGDKGNTGDQGAKGAQGAQGDQGAKGQTGAQGDAGDKGLKGVQGPQGTTGVKGDPGEDVFIIYYSGFSDDALNSDATVDKDNPPVAPNMNGGSSAVSGAFRLTQADGTVSDWYTSPVGLTVYFIASAVAESITQAPQADWTVSGYLQGAKGETGDAGDKGVKGIVGDTGAKGETGAQGAKGAQGAQGDQGAKGIVGAQGTKGSTGDKGNQGAQGSKGTTGAQGDKGAQGAQGDKGAQGAQGAKGQTGDTGDKGTKGGVGDAGAKGQQGDTGDKGTKGGVGDGGAKGQQGDTGDKGTKGGAGADGAKGQQGDTGDKGQLGVKGAQGSPGADAPYVVIGFDSTIDTNAERVSEIKDFSGLTTVLANSVYWDAVNGIPYQNQGSDSSNPTLTALTGSNGIVNMDSIKLGTGNDRVELSSSGMKVFSDVSGSAVLRVKIGDLS